MFYSQIEWEAQDKNGRTPFGQFIATHLSKCGDWDYPPPPELRDHFPRRKMAMPKDCHPTARNTLLKYLRKALSDAEALKNSIERQYRNNQRLKSDKRYCWQELRLTGPQYRMLGREGKQVVKNYLAGDKDTPLELSESARQVYLRPRTPSHSPPRSSSGARPRSSSRPRPPQRSPPRPPWSSSGAGARGSSSGASGFTRRII